MNPDIAAQNYDLLAEHAYAAASWAVQVCGVASFTAEHVMAIAAALARRGVTNLADPTTAGVIGHATEIVLRRVAKAV